MARQKFKKYWSAAVTKHSNALDLDRGVFAWSDPKRIARSLKKSAESSSRRKSSPKQSAMSMLNFYINRAGKNLGSRQKKNLEQAKEELRELFNVSTTSRTRPTTAKTSRREAIYAERKTPERSQQQGTTSIRAH